MSTMPETLRAALSRVRLLSCDVDGVMTDGGLYYTETGDVMRKYNVKDGMGLEMIRQAGFEVCIISASQTPAITMRGAKLKVRHTHTGVEDKLTTLKAICTELGIGLDQVAHIADDVNDLPVLRAVGCPLTVADAVESVKAVALYRTEKKGGDGAVREVCDLLLSLVPQGE